MTLDYNMQFFIVIMVIMMVGAAIYLACIDPLRWATLALVQLAVVVAVVVVGVLLETRLYVELIPLSTAAIVLAAARTDLSKA